MKTRFFCIISISLFLFAVAVFPKDCPASPYSGFGSNLDGWTMREYFPPYGPSSTYAVSNEIHYVSDGGNPGGYAQFAEEAGDSWERYVAPGKFLGNWLSMGIGSITYEMKIFDCLVPPDTGPFEFRPYQVFIGGPGGVATWIGQIPEGLTDWTTINVPLIEAAFMVSVGNWNAILQDVRGFLISADMVNYQDYVGLDNVRLNPIPEPATMLLLGSGLLGFASFKKSFRKK